MKSLFLSLGGGDKLPGRSDSNRLIIFFNGWSLDENIIKHLDTVNYNVLMFYDYSDLEISEEILEKCNSYQEINIISWSFGVWACSAVINKFNKLKNVIAINGTPVPIDNSFGIPEKIFNLTLSNLSEKNYPLFYKNMFLKFEKNFLKGLPNRDIANQTQELTQIKNLSSSLAVPIPQQFTKIFVGTQDKIIPAKNQIKFWSQYKELPIIELNEGHCIFNSFKNWDEIVGLHN